MTRGCLSRWSKLERDLLSRTSEIRRLADSPKGTPLEEPFLAESHNPLQIIEWMVLFPS